MNQNRNLLPLLLLSLRSLILFILLLSLLLLLLLPLLRPFPLPFPILALLPFAQTLQKTQPPHMPHTSTPLSPGYAVRERIMENGRRKRIGKGKGKGKRKGSRRGYYEQYKYFPTPSLSHHYPSSFPSLASSSFSFSHSFSYTQHIYSLPPTPPTLSTNQKPTSHKKSKGQGEGNRR